MKKGCFGAGCGSLDIDLNLQDWVTLKYIDACHMDRTEEIFHNNLPQIC